MLLGLRSYTVRSPLGHRVLPLRRYSSDPNAREDRDDQKLQQEEDTIFRFIDSDANSDSMISFLKSSGIALSNSLVDRVLNRIRYSRGSPLKTLGFFEFAGRQEFYFHTPFSYDTMLFILGRGRRFHEMWNLLLEIKRRDGNLITMRTMQIVLGRIAKVCSVRQTVEGFRNFHCLVGEFNTDCFNALLRILCQEKSMSGAIKVYQSLKREFSPNLQTFNILLAGSNTSEEAELFFKEMGDLGLKPDLVTYNCFVEIYCKNQELDKAFKVFDEMREREISPDVFTCTSIIKGLGLLRQSDRAREVLKDMRELGCRPDAAAYNAVIRSYFNAERVIDAFEVMEEMESRGVRPNPTSFNIFFDYFYKANDLENAWKLYERMRGDGCLPNSQSCMFLVRLCRRQEKVGLALELWNDMVMNGFGSINVIFDVLIELLCGSGKLDEAERCFVQMIGTGQKPSFVAFKRIICLMELAKRHESVRHLKEKMSVIENVVNE